MGASIPLAPYPPHSFVETARVGGAILAFRTEGNDHARHDPASGAALEARIMDRHISADDLGHASAARAQNLSFPGDIAVPCVPEVAHDKNRPRAGPRCCTAGPHR